MAIFPGSAIPSAVSDYEIDQSCLFFDDDKHYLSRTAGSAASDTMKWTYSGWIKFSSTTGMIFMGGPSVNDNSTIKASGVILMLENHTDPSTSNFKIKTNQVFRDYAAWYHIFVAYDSTQGVEADRIKIYVNGERVTSFSEAAYPSLNTTEPYINVNAKNQMISKYGTDNDTGYYDGYMAEVHVIDGTASFDDFGELDSTTNQWKPIEYEGSYGNNGFYLKFQDSSALGDDSSGNTNDFTSTNMAVDDQRKDSPTNNFAVLNPLLKSYGNVIYRWGNTATSTDNYEQGYVATISPTTGKWYWEFTVNKNDGFLGAAGIFNANSTVWTGGQSPNDQTGCLLYEWVNGNKYLDGTASSYGDVYTTNEVIGCALNIDDGEFTFYNENVSQSTVSFSGTSFATAGTIIPGATSDASGFHFNFGQDSTFNGAITAGGNSDANGYGDFKYEPPTDFLALCTNNIPSPEIALPGENFNIKLYDDGAGAKTGVGFQPDLVWVKSRGSAYDHKLTDVVRGVTKALVSNDPGVAQTTDTTGLTAFGADGFTVGADTDYSDTTGTGMVAWNWKAGGTGVTNTDGDIAGTVTVSANTTAGFSIVQYTGSGSVNTVGHGLSEAPDMIFAKDTTTTAAWRVAGENIPTAWTSVMYLNQQAYTSSDSTQFNSTAPTASVFTLGTGGDINASGNVSIAYCFHSVDGYSKLGTFVGNGAASDNTFIYTGFRPAYVMGKWLGANDWWVQDNKRKGYNLTDWRLRANSSGAEENQYGVDLLSNGIKIRDAGGGIGQSGRTYMFLAFAESPFKTSNAR